MYKAIFKTFAILLCSQLFYPLTGIAQEDCKFSAGIHYGYGTEFNNRNYTFTNRFVKGQVYYRLAESGTLKFEILIQPEVNFGEHQLLNLYFVTPDENNYEEKRERFTKLKDLREYVLNVGFLVRKPLSDSWSVYALGSVGPLITDTETERLSKGFAFADVFAIGVTYKTKKTAFDVRPSVRHTSNAGLQSSNAGFNTLNVEVGVSFPL
jgi:hypothetical protein